MNNAANIYTDIKGLQITFNGVKSDIFGADKLDWCKAQCRQMRDEFGWKVSLKWVVMYTADEQRNFDAERKARILALVDHEDDDGSAREIASEMGWL